MAGTSAAARPAAANTVNATTGAEGAPDSDLLGAQFHGIGNDAEDAGAREREHESGHAAGDRVRQPRAAQLRLVLIDQQTRLGEHPWIRALRHGAQRRHQSPRICTALREQHGVLIVLRAERHVLFGRV